MNLFERWRMAEGLPDFLATHANPMQKERWAGVHAQVSLTEVQRQILSSFTRQMNVLCLAGAWCGDCINQCPIFEHFGSASAVITMRYLDRDTLPDVRQYLQINGGDRIPVLVFFSEDGFEAARYGERTLSKYRQLMRDHAGASLPSVLRESAGPLLHEVTQDWLNEFERVQWLLRLSPRLRQAHAD